MIERLRANIHPGLRGAFFYATFWGAVGMYEPFLSVYFLRLGLSEQEIGWLAAVLPLGVMVLAPLVTRLADRYHRRVLFLALACLGYAAALTVPALPGLRLDFPRLLGLVALLAVFRSPIVSLADSLVTNLATRRALDFGSMRLWGSIIFTLTAASLGLLWERTGFTIMFLVAAAFFLPVVLAALLLEEPPRLPPTQLHDSAVLTPENLPVGAPTRFRPDPSLLFLLISTFLSIAALFMAGTFGAVYMTQLGGAPVLVGLMMGISALGEVPGMLFGARAARRLGDTGTLLLGYLICALGLAGYALIHIPWLLAIFSVVRGLGFGLLLVSTVTIINNRAPHSLASTYQGILNAACWGLAPLLGGPLSGWIYQNLGPAALFLTAGGVSVLAALLIIPTFRLWKAEKPVPSLVYP